MAYRVGTLSRGATFHDGTPYADARYATIEYSGSGFDTIQLSTHDIPSGYRFHHWVIEFSGGDKAPSFVSPCYSATYSISNPKDASRSGTLKATLYITSGSGPTPGDTFLEVDTNPSPAAGGTTSGDGVYWGSAGSQVTVPLRATPAAHWVFDYWSGSSGWSSESRNVNLKVTLREGGDSRSYTAHFSKTQYKVTGVASPANGGTVTPASQMVDFDHTATLTATPKPDYTFDHWSNGATTPTISFTPTSNVTLTAYFTWNGTYTVTTRPNDPAMGSTSPSSQTVNPGESVHITATPNENYEFVNWSDGDTNSDRTVTPEGPLDLVANFEQVVYRVTAAANDNKFPVNPPVQYVSKGSSCTITADLVDKWYPYRWYHDGTSVGNMFAYTHSFTPTKDTAVTVSYYSCVGIEVICPAIINASTCSMIMEAAGTGSIRYSDGFTVINFPGLSWFKRRYSHVYFELTPTVSWLRIRRFRTWDMNRSLSPVWSEWMDWTGSYRTNQLYGTESLIKSNPIVYKIEFDVEILPGSGLILYGEDGNILHGTNDRIVYADRLT